MDRPVLAPGLRVLRRSRGELQVGLTPAHRVRLPDTAAVRRTLDRLLAGDPVPDDPDCRSVLDALSPLLVDGAGLVVPGMASGDVAAVALADPVGYRSRLALRRRTEVSVTGSLGDAVPDPRPLLSAAGVGVTASGPGAVTVLLVHGDVDRARLDPLVRGGVPHLLVRLVEGAAVLGPFVDPGRTACLRCLDAHRAVEDPSAAALAAQHAHPHRGRRDGVSEPVDTALAALTVAWAVRDVVTFVDGDRPTTWSSTVELAAALGSLTLTEWLRHPSCGCGWLHDEQLSRTMEG